MYVACLTVGSFIQQAMGKMDYRDGLEEELIAKRYSLCTVFTSACGKHDECSILFHIH